MLGTIMSVSLFSKEVAYPLSIGHNKFFVVSPSQITSTMQTNEWNLTLHCI